VSFSSYFSLSGSLAAAKRRTESKKREFREIAIIKVGDACNVLLFLFLFKWFFGISRRQKRKRESKIERRERERKTGRGCKDNALGRINFCWSVY
jgi:hypothetical protein